MKVWLFCVLLVSGSCSALPVVEQGHPAPAVLNVADFVAQVPAGQEPTTIAGWRNPSIHVGEFDIVVVERPGAAGSTCEEAHIDNLSTALRSLPTSDWPDGRSISIHTFYGLDEARSARVRQQAVRVRSVARELQLTIIELATHACG